MLPSHSQKINLAKEQLEDAISMFVKGRYVSCLTLAGAAEEVLTALVESKTGKNPFNIIHEIINYDLVAMGRQKITRGHFRKTRNRARNSVKHHNQNDSEYVYINRRGQAAAMLGQAIISADLIELKYKYRRKYFTYLQNQKN
jgi:hypothetical protein